MSARALRANRDVPTPQRVPEPHAQPSCPSLRLCPLRSPARSPIALPRAAHVNARAPRRHLPAGLYEARPYVAIVVGGIAAIGSLVHALSLGEESALACVVLGVGCLLVDGRPVAEPQLVLTGGNWELPPRRVAPGRLFVAGDNRAMPIDQHVLGEAELERIAGAPVW